jgi:hypothetical protein
MQTRIEIANIVATKMETAWDEGDKAMGAILFKKLDDYCDKYDLEMPEEGMDMSVELDEWLGETRDIYTMTADDLFDIWFDELTK